MEDRAGVTWRADLSFFPPSSARGVSHDQVYIQPFCSTHEATFQLVYVCTKRCNTYTRSSTNHRDTRPTFLRLSLNIQPRRVAGGHVPPARARDDLFSTLLLNPAWMEINTGRIIIRFFGRKIVDTNKPRRRV